MLHWSDLQMCNSSILPELQTQVQLPSVHIHLDLTHTYLTLMLKLNVFFSLELLLPLVSGIIKPDTHESSLILSPPPSAHRVSWSQKIDVNYKC